jgi:hypothetical protein
MARNRRISKKLHHRCLDEVLYAISVSHVWRARLYEAGVGREFSIDGEALDDVPPSVARTVKRYALRYVASWVPHTWTRGWEGHEDRIMFRLRAAEFPQIVAFSANNPWTIYGRPRAVENS